MQRFRFGTVMVTVLMMISALVLGGFAHHGAPAGDDYEYFVTAPLAEGEIPDVLTWKLLLDDVNVGDEQIRVAELAFPAGYQGQAHGHGAVEIFYVLSGRFIHAVNGVRRVLVPGEIGIVRPGDDVSHGVEGGDPVRVLTIWVPGGADAPFHGVLHGESE